MKCKWFFNVVYSKRLTIFWSIKFAKAENKSEKAKTKSFGFHKMYAA